MYCVTITMTTVGCADITPTSDMERLSCTVAMLLGISIMPVLLIP